MSKKIKILSAAILIFAVSGIYFFAKVLSPNEVDIEKVSSNFEVSSQSLVASYLKNEKKAENVYTDKVIEITGILKEVTFLNNRNTLILQGSDTDSGIICDMKSDQLEKITNLNPGDKVTIKGVCKGFLKDVIVLNCILLN